MNKIELKVVLLKRLEDAEYWANKNGYEQEAIREILSILKLVALEIIGED